jgi:ribosome-interacting GTPase 1
MEWIMIHKITRNLKYVPALLILNKVKDLSAQSGEQTKLAVKKGMTRAKAFNPILRNNHLVKVERALIWIWE